MVTLVEGPAWGVRGTSGEVVRNPLRVENSIFLVVNRLLPGVISTTPHSRYVGLHGLVRTEATRRGLTGNAANDLMRRCEAITAAIAVHHEHHLVTIPEAHGQSRVRTRLDADGGLDVVRVSARGQYSEYSTGFYATYRGSEIELGVVTAGAAQEPGDRYFDDVVRPALSGLLELAEKDHITADELGAHGHLCHCASQGSEAEWLREIVGGTAGGDNYATADEARHETIRLIARTFGGVGARIERLWRDVRHGVSYGPPLDQGPYAGIEITEAWRGLMLRNRSVAAWRNLWVWIVDELADLQPAAVVGDAVASHLPEDWTVSDLTSTLPPGVNGLSLLPVEEELRAAHPRPDVLTELQMLAVGARRLDELTGRTHAVMAGDNLDDLGPLWVQEQLSSNARRPIRDWVCELVELLLWRSQRIAMAKMDLRNAATPRLPAQVVERDGSWVAQKHAGEGEPNMRIPSLISMLAGAGVLGADDDAYWLTNEGARFLV